MDPEFEAAWKANGSPPGDIPSDIPTFQETVQATLPDAQQMLAAIRPANIVERGIQIPIDDTFSSRTIVCQSATSSTTPSPLVILIYGGGHCVGYPEMELTTARALVWAHNATCILPSYRLAPDHPFPTDVNDVFAVVHYIACKATEKDGGVLPANADPKKGFVIGGLSAGAAISTQVAQLARDLEPPLTGQFPVCGIHYVDPSAVPDRYKELHLSMEQNKSAPIFDTASLEEYMGAYTGDKPSSLSSPYRGLSHAFWTMYPDLPATRRRMRDTVDGVGWLLGDK
ncbi:Alpha/Beta hydrolase protein [Trichoderma novae-zelandiae]